MSEFHSVEADDAAVVELVDVEEFGKAGQKPPKARRYRIRIDKESYIVDDPDMTGRELMVLAAKTPPNGLSSRKSCEEAKPKRLAWMTSPTSPDLASSVL